MEKKAENTDLVEIRQNGGFVLMFNTKSLSAE
jgi:hypothetical protein